KGALSPRAEIEEYGRDQERRREHVLPRRDPRHRLHMGWVEREEEPGHDAEPEPPEETPHELEREDGIEGVEEDLLQVVPDGPETPEAVIQHIRNELERHVAHEIGPGEDVAEVLGGPAADPGILRDVPGIVPAHEIEAEGGPEEKQRGGRDARGGDE